MGWTNVRTDGTLIGAMDDHLRQVGARICVLREQKQLTQHELGDLVGVGEKTISRWETGQHRPVLANLRTLAEALGVDIQDITGQLPAPLGLGASEDQVQAMATEFRGYVLDIRAHLAEQDADRANSAELARELLERQSRVLSGIEELLRRQSTILAGIERHLEVVQATEDELVGQLEQVAERLAGSRGARGDEAPAPSKGRRRRAG